MTIIRRQSFPPRDALCPACHRTRMEERHTPEICGHQFHDRLPAWKGWTP